MSSDALTITLQFKLSNCAWGVQAPGKMPQPGHFCSTEGCRCTCPLGTITTPTKSAIYGGRSQQNYSNLDAEKTMSLNPLLKTGDGCLHIRDMKMSNIHNINRDCFENDLVFNFNSYILGTEWKSRLQLKQENEEHNVTWKWSWCFCPSLFG